MKITLDRERCIGCGSCSALCPKYFEMADDGKANLVGSNGGELEVEKADCADEAASACPVEIIHVVKK